MLSKHLRCVCGLVKWRGLDLQPPPSFTTGPQRAAWPDRFQLFNCSHWLWISLRRSQNAAAAAPSCATSWSRDWRLNFCVWVLSPGAELWNRCSGQLWGHFGLVSEQRLCWQFGRYLPSYKVNIAGPTNVNVVLVNTIKSLIKKEQHGKTSDL